jgi:hypothetical protein
MEEGRLLSAGVMVSERQPLEGGYVYLLFSRHLMRRGHSSESYQAPVPTKHR